MYKRQYTASICGLTSVNDPPFLLLCSTSTCESCVSYMTPFPTPYSTSICGFCVSSRLPPFSTFRQRSYTRFSNSPRNNIGVVFFLWFLPDWCTIKIQWVLFRRTLFCVVLCFGYHALHKPSPHGLGCSMCSRVCFFYIPCIGFMQ